MPTHLSLFTGIGGADIAAEWAGFEAVGQVEWADYPTKVLEKHWPDVPRWRDIREFNIEGFRTRTGLSTVDVISGGFPCQDISYAKTWTTNGEYSVDGIDGSRSGLWKEYKRIIQELNPKFVVAENVKALTKKGLDVVLQDIAELGYYAEWGVIPACSFGAVHRRERIFIVAYPKCIGRESESIVFSRIFNKEIRQAPEWELSRTVCEETGKKTLPETFGIHDGIPRHLDDAKRMTCLGNAIVPQQIYPIFDAISQLLGG